jgi:protease-4
MDSGRIFAAAALLIAALPARAQTSNLAELELPPAVAVPNATVAGAEEPAGLSINPAAPGFVRRPSLQYFHEEVNDSSFSADAAFLSLPLGHLVPTLALDWMRPGDTSRFRRTTLGLAVGKDVLSLGGAFTWFHSPDPELERLTSWGAGLTVRPTRWLSVAGSATDRDMRLAGVRLPARYAVGAAVRVWEDRLTVSTDLLASERAKNAFDPNGIAFGLGAELWRGLAVAAQVQTPIDEPEANTVAQVALTWNLPYAGFTGGFSDRGGSRGDGWIAGFRASGEAYRASPAQSDRTVRVDVARELESGKFLFFPGKRDPFGSLLDKLRDMREDPSVREVVLVLDGVSLGVGRTEELRGAVAALAARKRVLAYVRGGRIREYWLASAATEISAPPSAVVDLSGIATTTPFLRDGLARIGVAFEVVAAGRYKNAPDPLVRSDMSDAQREVTEDVLDRVFGAMVRDIAAGRRVPEERVREWVDRALFTAADAHAAGVIDAVSWPDELGVKRSPRGGGAYAAPERRRAQRWGPRPLVAVVPVEGAIVQGRSRSAPLFGEVAGGETLSREIRRAVEDGAEAIVLRIDSPGGDALASDLVWREVVVARQRGIPVIASMGDLAASGGYLIACGADAIIAQPTTLTGSIGVFVVKPDFSGLLGKLGVNPVTSKRGENATLRSTSKAWSATERAAVERAIHGFYDIFLSRVAAGRGMDKAEVEKVAGGRVWTGAEALERGLVDRLGSLADAIALARERAGIGAREDITLRRYDAERGFLASVAGTPAADPITAMAQKVPELAAAALLVEIDAPVALPIDWVSGGSSSGGATP